MNKTHLRYFKIFSLTFITIALADFIWRNLVFYKFYFERLVAIARVQNTIIFPVMEYAMVAHALITAFATWMIVSNAKKLSLKLSSGLGAAFGLTTWGAHAFLTYAYFKEAHYDVFALDVAWSLLLGCILGMVIHKLSQIIPPSTR